jgi:hypothetical protein
MNRDLKKEALEKFAKQLSVGDYSSGNLIMPDKALGTQALQARDIAEQALANEFLKNTGLPVPDRFTSVGKAEDFLNRSLKEAYPELEPNLKLLSEKEDPFLKGNLGTYSPKKSGIILNRAKFSPSDIKDLLATTFHEGAHQYDDKILKYRLPKELAQEKSQLDFKKAYDTAKELDRPIDPTEMYEIAAKGHHARIPKLRDADSFGLGALKSYLKSGTLSLITSPAMTSVVLNTPSVWTGQQGINSLLDYLNNPILQNLVQNEIMQGAFQGLLDAGILVGNESASYQATFLQPATRYGVDAVVSWVQGTASDELTDKIQIAARQGQYAIAFIDTFAGALNAGIDSPGFINTVDRQELDQTLAEIIGNEKIPSVDYADIVPDLPEFPIPIDTNEEGIFRFAPGKPKD